MAVCEWLPKQMPWLYRDGILNPPYDETNKKKKYLGITLKSNDILIVTNELHLTL